MVMKEIKAGDIIDVIANWTKGQVLQYLVTFADAGGSFLTGIRIMQYNDAANTGTQIPELNDKAYANVFTGFHAINIGDVKNVVTTVSDETYNRITSAVFSVMNGEYSKTANGFYRVNKKTFSYADVFLALNRMDDIHSIEREVPEDPIVETADVRPEAEVHNNTSKTKKPEKTTKKKMEKPAIVKGKKTNEADKSPKTKDFNYRNMVAEYHNISDNDARIDWLFKHFAENGKYLPIGSAYSICIEHKDTKTIGSSIMLTKEEFRMFSTLTVKSFPGDAQVRRKDGSLSLLSRHAVSQLINKCKKLYYGQNTASINKLSQEKINEILEDYITDMNSDRILTKYGISYHTLANYKSKYLGTQGRKSFSYSYDDVTKRIISASNICSASERAEIVRAIQYINDNKDKIGIIANGYADNFKGNKDVLICITQKIIHGKQNYLAAFSAPDSLLRLSSTCVKAIFCNNGSKSGRERMRLKLYLLSIVAQNKDEYDWKIAPGNLRMQKGHIYQCLDRALHATMEDVNYTTSNDMLKGSGIIRDLRTIIGVPDNYLTYYFNMSSKRRRRVGA